LAGFNALLTIRYSV